jgi:hypothetical protein
MKMSRPLTSLLYLIFLICLCFVCFKNQIPGDFDRYIYESIVRGKHQPVETIYPIVKHSNPRAEASSILDSPEHLGQLEPLYAIRPLYTQAIAVVAYTGMPYQRAISLVSALSLFLIGIVLVAWTNRPLYSALLLATPAVVGVARSGTPDALSGFFVLTSAWALASNRMFIGLALLLASVWVRTDNVLFVMAVLIWLAWTKRLLLPHFAALAGLAGTSVLLINYFSGNYGWRVLFRYTFIGGRYIANVQPELSFSEYLTAFVAGVRQIGGQEIALFVLIGLAATKWLPANDSLRPLLMCVAIAAIARFLLFPSPENRYFIWAYLIAGAALIRAIAVHAPRIAQSSLGGGTRAAEGAA